MTKRQLVKWLEAKQSDAKAEVEIQYATAEKAYFAQRDEALKINETVDEVFRLISEADTVVSRWKEALEKVKGIDTTCGWYTSLTTKLSDLSDKENIRMYIMKDFTDGTLANGAKLTGLDMNGTNYVSKEKVDETIFKDNLSTMKVSDGETETTYTDMVFIQQMEWADGTFYLAFREKTKEEKLVAALNATSNSITDVQVALAEVYEMVLGGN